MALPEAISIKKTAELLDVNQMTVRRWIKRGFIKAYRIGPYLIRIPRSEIVRLRTLRIEASDLGIRTNYPEI